MYIQFYILTTILFILDLFLTLQGRGVEIDRCYVSYVRHPESEG